MKFRILSLTVECKRGVEVIPFSDITYFYGPMGSGKSSIARLIDYCLGGELEVTPALQSEFISASLSVTIASNPVTLTREINSPKIRAKFDLPTGNFEVLIPARKPAGAVIPDTGVEVLSDLLFNIAGITPPRVKRSKLNDESDLQRLSFRDLYWYCYLDQSQMDSNFFNLDPEANLFKQLKSRDVLRLLVGFHHEKIAELEEQLTARKDEKERLRAGLEGIKELLKAANFSSELEIAEQRTRIQNQIKHVGVEIAGIRTADLQNSALRDLQDHARTLSTECNSKRETLQTLQERIAGYKSHKNELLSLSTKFRRSLSARAILGNTDFASCPQCNREIPPNTSNGDCGLCRRPIGEDDFPKALDSSTESDLKARIKELTELCNKHEMERERIRKDVIKADEKLERLQIEINRQMEAFDSAILSQTLQLERSRAASEQELIDLKKIEHLSFQIERYQKRIYDCEIDEKSLREKLREARKAAESKADGIAFLKRAFLECLLASRIPGYLPDDVVSITAPYLLPEISNAKDSIPQIISFANSGSGGKKTFFKCCFAVAVHLLARERNAILPTLLIIDSPMKNLSERENKEQFFGFHEMLYELAADALHDTQIILIDSEMKRPKASFPRPFSSRHMTLDDIKAPPLITYYRGK